MTTLQTERLLLRPWKQEDRKPFTALNADARVMEYFPATLSKEESEGMAVKIEAGIAERGWGLLAV